MTTVVGVTPEARAISYRQKRSEIRMKDLQVVTVNIDPVAELAPRDVVGITPPIAEEYPCNIADDGLTVAVDT